MSGIDLGIPGLENLVCIGQGGSSVVYQAKQGSLDRLVAVKVLRESWDDRSKKRFERETRAMGRLSEDLGIVPIYESGETVSGDPFFIMPFYENGSLQTQIETGGPFEWDEAVSIIEVVGETISTAHSLGVVHRDIKPANLLLSNSRQPIVSDFGIARITSDGSSPVTQSAFFTPAYSPPESFVPGGSSDPTVDVYGLAATLWALLAGRAPFVRPGEKVNSVALLTRVSTEPVDDLRASVPEPICDLVERAMSKAPEDRPQTVEAFLGELRRAQEESMQEPLVRFSESPPPAPAPAPMVEVSDMTEQIAVLDLPAEAEQKAEPRAGLAVAPTWELAQAGVKSSAITAMEGAGSQTAPAEEKKQRELKIPLLVGAASLVVVGLFASLLWAGRSNEPTAADSSNPAGPAAEAGGSDDRGYEKLPVGEATEVVRIVDDSFRVFSESFATGDRLIRDGSDIGIPLKLQTSVVEMTSTSAVVVVYTNQCSVARFVGRGGAYGSEGWPATDNCTTAHKRTFDALEPGKRNVISITLVADGTPSTRTAVEFVTPPTDDEAVEIIDLQMDSTTESSVAISFETSQCSIVQIDGVGSTYTDEGWPDVTPGRCNTEHEHEFTDLQPNSVHDLEVTITTESGVQLSVGITTWTSSNYGQAPTIQKSDSIAFAQDAVEVWFETDLCASATFVIEEGRSVSYPGCATLHRYVFFELEPDRTYTVQVVARNDFGQSEIQEVTFTTGADE